MPALLLTMMTIILKKNNWKIQWGWKYYTQSKLNLTNLTIMACFQKKLPNWQHAFKQNKQFLKLLKTDATTINSQEYVAEYFKVSEQWKNKKETNALPSYFKLLKLIKQHRKEDHIGISFWDGMHRHVAITLSLLCADITYTSSLGSESLSLNSE